MRPGWQEPPLGWLEAPGEAEMVAVTEAPERQPAAGPVAATREEEVSPVERGTYDGDTAMKLYLREIGQVKLLTPAEEVTLAERIKAGDKDARELMIRANLRLVVKIAHDYEGFGLPLLDLVSEGNIGLMNSRRAV